MLYAKLLPPVVGWGSVLLRMNIYSFVIPKFMLSDTDNILYLFNQMCQHILKELYSKNKVTLGTFLNFASVRNYLPNKESRKKDQENEVTWYLYNIEWYEDS